MCTGPIPNPLQRRVLQHAHSGRRGAALVVVMVAISVSMVLTYSFLHTQATVLQISDNLDHRDIALRAAETGAAMAFARMHAADWEGVQETVSRVVHSDRRGIAAFYAEYQPYSTPDASESETAAMTVVVHSVGRWQSAEDDRAVVERHVEIVAQLVPRIPTAETPAAANDLASNPGDYDAIQRYALFAGSGSDSLTLDPAGRVEGDLWLYDNLRLYQDPDWDSGVRREYLNGIGELFGAHAETGQPFDVHPLAGRISFYDEPSGHVKQDLTSLKLNNSWQRIDNRLRLPAVTHSDWTSYRLFEGGFEYRAVPVDSRLENVTLQPTPDNPLGIFYRYGSIVVEDNVTIHGTLVSPYTIHLAGNDVHLTALNWLGAGGEPLAGGAAAWPRLPAIVAGDVSILPDVRVSVNGAVIAQNTMSGAGGDFALMSGSSPGIASGTATCRIDQQPHSIVTLQETRNLDDLRTDGSCSIFLNDGISGTWYRIVGMNSSTRELTILGEIGHDAEQVFNYRIDHTRSRFAEILGPVSTAQCDIHCPNQWSELDDDNWEWLHSKWQDSGADSFVTWLAAPYYLRDFDFWDLLRWLQLPAYVRQNGLDLRESTFLLRYRPQDAERTWHRWSPPLFRPFTGVDDDDQRAGYRWRVITWREVATTALGGIAS